MGENSARVCGGLFVKSLGNSRLRQLLWSESFSAQEFDLDVVSVIPMFMTNREAVERFPMNLPLRHKAVHERNETGIVCRFKEVNHFVNYDVFKTLLGFLGEIGVEANTVGNRVAATPFGLHTLYKKIPHLHTDDRFPFCHQRCHGLLELNAIPILYNGLSLVCIGARANPQMHPLVRQFDGR